MIRKKEDQIPEERMDVCEGKGPVHLLNVYTADELPGARMFARITVDPGSVFGRHQHHDEAEIYYLLKGELVTESDGQEYALKPGDSSMTKDGEIHLLRNETDESAELLAVILGKGSVTVVK